MTFDIDSAARRGLGVAVLAAACGLTACGGGDEATPITVARADTAPTVTTTARLDSGAGEVASDQLPSVMSTVAGLPSDQDLGQAPSL